MAKRNPGGKARLKLVRVGLGRVLLARLCLAEGKTLQAARARLGASVSSDYLAFDGQVFRVSHDLAIDRVVKLLGERCELVYDPNLGNTTGADPAVLPNPWPMKSLPVRDPLAKPLIYMARVWHPEMAESLAFQIPDREDDCRRDDLEIAFDRELPAARAWRRDRKDLDRVPVTVVADHYEPRVHDVLDRLYDCWWDEFLAGEEWSVLPHPEPTQYPVRALSEADFFSLEVEPFGPIDEINLAYREKKEDYLNNRISAEEWLDVDVAYQRIRRHHFPSEPDLPDNVVAPVAVVRRLRELLPGHERDRVRWFHAFCYPLGGVPADLVRESAGEERVLRYLRDVPALLPGGAFTPS